MKRYLNYVLDLFFYPHLIKLRLVSNTEHFHFKDNHLFDNPPRTEGPSTSS